MWRDQDRVVALDGGTRRAGPQIWDLEPDAPPPHRATSAPETRRPDEVCAADADADSVTGTATGAAQVAVPPAPSSTSAHAPTPASAAPLPRTGRVKTRLIGFHRPDETGSDPFATAAASTAAAWQAGAAVMPATGGPTFPVGWLVVVSGPGRGASFELTSGVSRIGRGEDQAIRLDFGDTAISRDNHAAVAYDDEGRCFYLGQGGKANLVRLNDRPVLSTEAMGHGDTIRIGETVLRLVAFCGDAFAWDDAGAPDAG